MLKLSKSEELLQMLRQRAEAMNNGERFPSVRELMKEYNVSQFTVAPALAELEELGLIRREVGRGTFVHHQNRVSQKKVTLLFTEWPSSAIEDMCHFLEKEAIARNWRVQKTAYPFNTDIFSQLDKIDTDAIILDPPNPGDITPKQLEALSRVSVPVVLIRSDIPFAGINCVCGNNSAAGIIAANYLISNGHHKLGILLSEPHVNTSTELSDSFYNCAISHGADVTVIDCNTMQGQSSMHNAYSTMKQWLSVNQLNFTALFVVSDESTMGAYKALAEQNIAIPEQLSVMGFGNASTGAFFHPSLTTIDTDRSQMASAAMDIVEKITENHDYPGQQQKVYPNIVERQSVIKNNNQ